MAHGYPDYGVNVFALSQFDHDNAELAARLGSPYTILRSGHVIWMDGFENGVQAWTIYVNGTATCVQSNSSVYSGGYCMVMTDSNALNDLCSAQKRIPPVRLGTYAFDFMVAFTKVDASAKGLFKISIKYWSGSRLLHTDIQIQPLAGIIQIYSTIGGVTGMTTIETALGSLLDAPGVFTFHYCHLSVDIETGLCKLFVIDDNAYDLTEHSMVNTASVAMPVIEFAITSISSGTAHSNRIDNVVVTMDEL